MAEFEGLSEAEFILEWGYRDFGMGLLAGLHSFWWCQKTIYFPALSTFQKPQKSSACALFHLQSLWPICTFRVGSAFWNLSRLITLLLWIQWMHVHNLGSFPWLKASWSANSVPSPVSIPPCHVRSFYRFQEIEVGIYGGCCYVYFMVVYLWKGSQEAQRSGELNAHWGE